MKKTKIKLLAAGLLVLSACGGCKQNGAFFGGSAASQQTAATQDICLILPADEVSTLVGYAVTSNKEGVTGNGCNYVSGDTAKGQNILVNVRVEENDASARENFQKELDRQKQIFSDPMSKETSFPFANGAEVLLDSGDTGVYAVLSRNIWMTVEGKSGDGTKRDHMFETIGNRLLKAF